MKKLLIVLTLISCSAMAEDYDCSVMPCELIASEKAIDYSWTGGQVLKQMTLTSLLLVDEGQTLDIKYHSSKYYNPGIRETNQLLGAEPSDRRIKNYFLLSHAVEFTVASFLPKYRDIILNTGIAVESVVTRHNKTIGLSVKF